jgi:hypothetical protein
MACYLHALTHPGTKAPPCTRAPFRDVLVTSRYCGAIAWLSSSGAQTGASSLRFRPTSTVDRQTLATWVQRIARPSSAAPTCRRSAFTDVPAASAACGAIAWAQWQGVVVGSTATTFAPAGPVTRAVSATALHRLSDVLRPVLGADVSHPQCAAAGSSAAGALPRGQAFGVVGVNAGKPTTTNPCLAAQLAWAATSTGGTAQPKVQLYVNTANPGGERKRPATWPTSGKSAAYGWCSGSNSAACAYLYGRARAAQDYATAGIPDPAGSVWWLDVETVNTWDTTAGGTARNVAALEGMADWFREKKVAGVGLYATPQHWKEVVGSSVQRSSPLYALPSWLAGAPDLGGARRLCGAAALTAGGTVRLTQYIEGGFDRDHSCV